MKLCLNKKNSIDYGHPAKPPKSDRPSTRPYFVSTEINEATYYLDPNTSFTRKPLHNNLVNKQRPKSRPSVPQNYTHHKGVGKVAMYIKTEESGMNDVSDDLILKISRLKIELRNFKEKEKSYVNKINELEKDKEVLITTLDQIKQKHNETFQENKAEKRRLSFPIESLKLIAVDQNRSKVSKDTQSTSSTFKENNRESKDLIDVSEILYKTKFSEMLNTLHLKVQGIEAYANSLAEENAKMRKELEGSKKLNERLKTSSERDKIHLKNQQGVQNELAVEYKLLMSECYHLKSYLKQMISPDKSERNDFSLAKKTRQTPVSSCKKACLQPIPSYIKAMSLALCEDT